jgi:hypothetical protein
MRALELEFEGGKNIKIHCVKESERGKLNNQSNLT